MHKPSIVRLWIGAALTALSVLVFSHCVSGPSGSQTVAPAATSPSPKLDFILVAGQRVPIGTRVVTFEEADGYSAYREGKHFDRSEPADGKRRYSRRKNLPAGMAGRELTHADLKEVVHQFVVHYDVCGCSRQCFKVLQDVRNLSVHFMLDVDGTIYQTLDLRDKAWHATIANDFAVGIEIAHPGAWLSPLNADMRRWYAKDQQGWHQIFPKWMSETGVRTEGFVPRPERPALVSGTVQGRTYHQFDFTPEQYRALPKLMAGLNRALPRIRLEAPRNQDGGIVNRVMPSDMLRAFDGIVGHFHVQKNKQDPGPAFQWERMLREARALRDR